MVAIPDQAELDRELTSVPRDDRGSDGRPVTVDGLLMVADRETAPHTRAGRDRGEVGGSEEVREEPGELVLLGRCPGLPLAPEGQACRCSKVQAVVDHAADRAQELRRPFLEIRVLEQAVHRRERVAQRLGGWAGPGVTREDEDEDGGERDRGSRPP